MDYQLMHKQILVLSFSLDSETSAILRIGKIERPEHIPVGIPVRKGVVDRAALNAWWQGRAIPASRQGIHRALEEMSVPSTHALLEKCMGLSLSDQYWVRPYGSDLQWERINFFENPFSEDIGNVLLGKTTDAVNFDFSSPDNTTNGYLKKRWKIIGGKRCLLKAGSNPFMQQPFNEVIASLVAEKLGISHVPYTLLWDDDTPYSVCEDFVTPDTELVSAWRVMQSMKKDNSTSVYRHYLNCCEALGVRGMEHAVDQMIVLDYLIANEDRHQNNFGLLRNVDTLEWLGAAPVFDSGSSMGYDKLTPQILSARTIECKPFKKTHEEQLKLVTSFDWIDFGKLNGIEQDVRDILDQAGEYMDENRKTAIISAFSSRLGQLMVLAQVQRQEDDVAQDVEQDRAQDYGFKMEL